MASSIILRNSVSRVVLDNGIRVVCENISYLKSVSVGVYLKVGARFETSGNNGISHFLEHLTHQGTKHRSRTQIAREMDSVGGDFDAYTSHESTCYSATVLREDLPLAMELLSDVVIHSTFPSHEFEKEKGVILDEIRTVEDSPEEFIQDRMYEILWKEHPLGKPILGTPGTIGSLDRDEVLEFRDSHYTGNNMVISAAGDIHLADLVQLVEKWFALPNPFSSPNGLFFKPTVFPRVHLIERDFGQVHFCMGTPGLQSSSEQRYAAFLLHNILGGNISSRLFQKIREEHGLCYSIYSYLTFHYDTGMLGIYGAAAPETFDRVVRLMAGELNRIRNEPVSGSELDRVKNQFRGNLILSLEDSAFRMSQLARQEMYFQRFIPLEELLEKIYAVTPDQIQELAWGLIDDRYHNFVVMGPVSSVETVDFRLGNR